METKSIAKIFAETSSYNVDYPNRPPIGSTSHGTGCCVEINNRYLLTAEHVIRDAVFVRASFREESLGAFRIVSKSRDLDLAILEPEDPKALDQMSPVTVETQANPGTGIRIWGYGQLDTLEMMQGHISGFIEIETPNMIDVVMQVSAEIRSGFSGGPVFNKNGNLVGVSVCVFKHRDESRSCAVPGVVIANYLRVFAKYGEYPELWIGTPEVQTLENPKTAAIRKADKEYTGVRICNKKCWPLKQGDVLHAVNGKVLTNTGKVSLPEVSSDMISFRILFFLLDPEIPISFTIIRRGRLLNISHDPKKKMPLLVPRYPEYEYCEVGGFLFVHLSYALDLPRCTWTPFENKLSTKKRRRIVVTTERRPSPETYGFSVDAAVKRVNGKVPRDLKHFSKLCEGPSIIELYNGRIICLGGN